MLCSCCDRPATWKVRASAQAQKFVGPIKALCDRCMAWAARVGRELSLTIDVTDLEEVGDSRQLDLFN